MINKRGSRSYSDLRHDLRHEPVKIKGRKVRTCMYVIVVEFYGKLSEIQWIPYQIKHYF